MATSADKALSQSYTVEESASEVTLPECFDRAFSMHQLMETTDESTASDNIQGKLGAVLITTEKAINMVNELQLFSQNEDIEEVSTNEVKYMLLSAYLGYFTCLNTHIPRQQAVSKSKMCYVDFLRLLKFYSVIQYDISLTEGEAEDENTENVVPSAQSKTQELTAMAAQRNNKIQRFKEKKEMEKKLTELKKLVDQEHVDDEVKREFYITQLKHWANFAIEEVDNCNLELQMLKHREEMSKQGNSQSAANATSSSKSAKKSKPFRPFILTKTQLQKQVFGAGYPSRPTMTVDEFYEQKLKEGTLSESVQGGHSMQQWAENPEKDAQDREREEAEKEERLDQEDPEALARARAMDDWKDDHRRGDGNRHNKG